MTRHDLDDSRLAFVMLDLPCPLLITTTYITEQPPHRYRELRRRLSSTYDKRVDETGRFIRIRFAIERKDHQHEPGEWWTAAYYTTHNRVRSSKDFRAAWDSLFIVNSRSGMLTNSSIPPFGASPCRPTSRSTCTTPSPYQLVQVIGPSL
jgi:hypothetical protein